MPIGARSLAPFSKDTCVVSVFSSMSFVFSVESSVIKKELKIAIPIKASKTRKGYGFLISATKGDKHASKCAKKFTIPYAVATSVVGKSLLTLMMAVLKMID